jgi:hypothetical protein
MNMTSATEGTGMMHAPSYHGAEHAYTLEEYGLGLDTYVEEALSMCERDSLLTALDVASRF